MFVLLYSWIYALGKIGGFAMKTSIFCIFGILQSLSLGVIILLFFNSLNLIHGEPVIGWDTQLLLSFTFPLFLLIVKCIIDSKKCFLGPLRRVFL